MTVASMEDDRRHHRAYTPGHLTQCGQHVAFTGPPADWPACHVCLPREAHPLAGVWAQCRRFDDDANVGAGEPR